MVDTHTATETSVNLFDVFVGYLEIVEWETKFRKGKYGCYAYQGNYIVRKERISKGTYDKDGLRQFCQSL